MSSSTRIVVATVSFALAVVLAVVTVSARGGDSAGTERGSGDARPPATSDIWAVGDRWVVNVVQNAAAVSPDETRSVAKVPYRFRVASAPRAGDTEGLWRVRVQQDGAQGPFADGWTLDYRADGDAMRLVQVAQGKQKPMPAELASIVLGMGFPYDVMITAPPKPASSIAATKLQARAALPPQAAVPTRGPQEDRNGVLPPSSTPSLPPGAMPPGAATD